MSHETALPAELLTLLGILPGAPPDGVLRAFLREQKATHPDNGGAVGSWLNVCWAYQAARAGEAYTADPHAWVRAHPRPAQLGDWRAVALEELCAFLPQLFDALEATKDYKEAGWEELCRLRMAEVEIWGEYLPEFWDIDRLGWTAGRPPALLDTRRDIESLVRLPELVHLAPAVFQTVYHVKAKKKAARVTLGSLKVLPASERATWATQPAPHFRLQLWWVWWAAMATWTSPRGYQEERYYLLHHELCHGRMKDRKGERVGAPRGHDVEEFGASAERYGARNLEAARLIRAAYLHPRTQQQLEEASARGDVSWLVPETPRPHAAPQHVPTADDWHAQILELRDELELALEEALEVDTGYLPADEIGARLAVLSQVGAVRPTDLADLAQVRQMIRRYRPVRT